MATVELTKDTFESTVVDNEIVIVDFWATWCGPCRAFAPTYEEASADHPDVVFGKVDTEDQQELAGAFGIQSIPTLMIFKDKVQVFSQAGALPGHVLDDLIEQVREIARSRHLVLQHLRELEDKIAGLQAMHDSLSELASCCLGDERPDCPILERLADNDQPLRGQTPAINAGS